MSLRSSNLLVQGNYFAVQYKVDVFFLIGSSASGEADEQVLPREEHAKMTIIGKKED